MTCTLVLQTWHQLNYMEYDVIKRFSLNTDWLITIVYVSVTLLASATKKCNFIVLRWKPFIPKRRQSQLKTFKVHFILWCTENKWHHAKDQGSFKCQDWGSFEWWHNNYFSLHTNKKALDKYNTFCCSDLGKVWKSRKEQSSL